MVQSEPERLLSIDLTATPETDRDAFTAQIQTLHWRLFGRRVAPDSAEVTSALELWAGLYTVGGGSASAGADAWAGLVSVLLRDPDMAVY